MVKKEAVKGSKEIKIVISKDGPYLVCGNPPLDKQAIVSDKDGTPIKWSELKKCKHSDNYALCRCGNSKDMPYCDASHSKIRFDGTETASREKYLDQAGFIKGPNLTLGDAPDFCVGAGFCHRDKGVWDLTEDSDDPKSNKLAIEEACDCPSGRLVAYDKKTGKPIEPNFKPSISLIEDPSQKISGPIWVKGSVKIESQDGKEYERRNRVTLCRCGKSNNKPFCDGAHVDINFNDGDDSVN